MKNGRTALRGFHDLSIRVKLFLTYLLLTLSLLYLFLVAGTYLSTKENEKQVLRSASHVFGQTKAYIEFKTESIRNLLYQIIANEDFKECLERRPEYYREDIGRWPIDSQNARQTQVPRNEHRIAISPRSAII